MPSFTNYKDLEYYLKFSLYDSLIDSAKLEQEMAEIMSKAVEDIVYAAYEPKEYVRRKGNDGLSDTRNMIISDIILEEGRLKIVFENIAAGNDTLSGDLLADTIEEGIRDNWMAPNSPYADPRPFIAETANRINADPSNIINAIKSELKDRGFKFS